MSVGIEKPFCLTFDIDWANDDIVQYTVDLLDQYDVKATFFATHRSDLLLSLDTGRFEIGVHPNFKGRQDYSTTVRELTGIFPDAKGFRSHGLLSSTGILHICRENGLKYDCNVFLPLHEHLHPVERFAGYYSIPYNFSDSSSLQSGMNFAFPIEHLKSSGMKVFTFHPIHIYMNTSSQDDYVEYKTFHNDLKGLERFRNPNKGIRTHFHNLLKHISMNNIETYKCEELIDM